MSLEALEFYLSDRYKWAISLGTGIFFYLFLLAFLPFGVDNYNPNHEYSIAFLLELLYFMVASIALMLASEFLLKDIIIKKATTPSILGWSVWLVITLGLGNYFLYNWLGNWHDLGWKSAVFFVLNCSSVFIFPLAGIFFLFRYQALRRSIHGLELDRNGQIDHPRLIVFEGEGKGDRHTVAADDFRYAQAQDNYVALFYLINGKLHKYLIRSSLSELLDQTAWEDLIRCHRSYAVNFRKVRSVRMGNPFLLYLKDLEDPIRVSRSYKKVVLSMLKTASETS